MEIIHNDVNYTPLILRSSWFINKKKLFLLCFFIQNFGIGLYTNWYILGWMQNNSELLNYASINIYNNLGIWYGLLTSIMRSFVFSIPPILFIGIILIQKILLRFYNWFYSKKYINKFEILFENKEKFEDSRRMLLNIIYNKKIELISLILAIVINIFTLISLFLDKIPTTNITFQDQFSTFPAYYTIHFVLSFLGGLLQGFITYYAILILFKFLIFVVVFGKLDEIRFIGKKEDSTAKATFEQYRAAVRLIGNFIFSINLIIIIIGLIVSISFFIAGKIMDTDYSFYIIGFCIGLFLLASIFILIQFGIHNNLIRGKELLLRSLESELNKRKLLIQANLVNEISCLELDINDFLVIQYYEREFEKISSMGTWTFDYPKILSLIVGTTLSLIPTIYEMVQFTN